MVQKIEIKEQIIIDIGMLADKHNISVYVVGGYVRDLLLDKPRTDIDCTVVGNAIAFAKIVAKHFHSKAVIYERFHTALVPIGSINVEFVGTRKEEYLPNSRKPITTAGTLEDDLRRRDFTINAMAASINSNSIGEIIDLFNGQQHLQARKLITPLEPTITYSDDPLRMMRAARFASQLQFELEQSSVDAITAMCDRITIISQERICDELMKIMSTQKPSIGLYILYNTGVLKHILPELNALAGVESIEDNQGKALTHKDILNHTLMVVDNVSDKSSNIWLRFAALFHDIAKPKTKRFIKGSGWHFHGHEERGSKMVEPIFRKLKLPLDNVEYVRKLIRLHLRPMQLVDTEVTDSAIRRLAVDAGDALEDLFILCRCDITSKNSNITQKYLSNYDTVAQKVVLVQDKDKLREFQSPVRGEEIMGICNIPPSRLVGVIKTNIENAILDGIIPNEYEAAKAYFAEHKDEWLATYYVQ